MMGDGTVQYSKYSSAVQCTACCAQCAVQRVHLHSVQCTVCSARVSSVLCAAMYFWRVLVASDRKFDPIGHPEHNGCAADGL